MVALEDFLAFIRYNLKIIFNINVIAALCYILVIPFIFSLRFIPATDMAKVGEIFLSFTGIILFPFLGTLEERDSIAETIYIKKFPFINSFIIRLIILLLINLLLIFGITTLAKLKGGNFPYLKYSLGISITSLFLGTLGLTITTLSKNVIAGYLISFTYYALEFTTKGKYTKDIFLFSLLRSSFYEKYWIMCLIIVMLIINLTYVYKNS